MVESLGLVLEAFGVAVEVLVGNVVGDKIVDLRPLTVDNSDGYIHGEELFDALAEKTGGLVLRATVKSRRNRQPFATKRDGKGNIVELRDDASVDVDDAVYEISVPLSTSSRGYIVPAAWPDNFLYVVIRGLEGRFSVIQVSVVSQFGVFFLRVQEMYSGQAWKNAGNFQVGDGVEFGPWEKLIPFLQKHMSRQNLLTVPPSAPRKFTPPTQNNVAVVRFFGDAMGFGYALVNPRQEVQMERGPRFTFTEVKVHWSQIVGDDRFKCLRPGDVVRFKAVIMRQGARGQHKGQLRPELEGVEIVSRG